MEVKRDREAKTLSISHKQMIAEVLDRNKMLGCRCSPTPLVPGEKDHESFQGSNPEESTVSNHKRFRKAVGSIQYIASVTRPNIAYAAHTLARHMPGSATKQVGCPACYEIPAEYD